MDVEIEFVLVIKVLNGICFFGIICIYMVFMLDGSSGQVQINVVIVGNDVYQGVWLYNKYFNVLVCVDIGGVVGYMFNLMGGFIMSVQGMFYNSVFVFYNYIGFIGIFFDFIS